MMHRLLQLAVLGLALVAAGAAADESALATGEHWTKATEAEKFAYINGAADFLTVEYIVQSKAETAPTEDQSSISRWWNDLSTDKPSELIKVVDAWYAANGDKLGTPVLVVIWNELVE